jgi:hypothetical protein
MVTCASLRVRVIAYVCTHLRACGSSCTRASDCVYKEVYYLKGSEGVRCIGGPPGVPRLRGGCKNKYFHAAAAMPEHQLRRAPILVSSGLKAY